MERRGRGGHGACGCGGGVPSLSSCAGWGQPGQLMWSGGAGVVGREGLGIWVATEVGGPSWELLTSTRRLDSKVPSALQANRPLLCCVHCVTSLLWLLSYTQWPRTPFPQPQLRVPLQARRCGPGSQPLQHIQRGGQLGARRPHAQRSRVRRIRTGEPYSSSRSFSTPMIGLAQGR